MKYHTIPQLGLTGSRLRLQSSLTCTNKRTLDFMKSHSLCTVIVCQPCRRVIVRNCEQNLLKSARHFFSPDVWDFLGRLHCDNWFANDLPINVLSLNNCDFSSFDTINPIYPVPLEMFFIQQCVHNLFLNIVRLLNFVWALTSSRSTTKALKQC